MGKRYDIGLDIGVTSVGWAIIDCEDFKIIRKGNKAMWGVRLFDEATTAEKRRLARSARRRYDRRRQRIKLLQEEFQDEISKVDNNFYQKMKETFYRETDIKNKTIPITDEEKKKIKDYNDKFPTIYHVRKELIDNKDKMDIRLVYLAIHHIIKYRGNFLQEGKDFRVSYLSVREKLENIFNLISEDSSMDVPVENIALVSLDTLEMALNEPSKNDRKIKLEKELSNAFDKRRSKELTKMLLGDNFSLNTIFNQDNNEDIKVSFKGSNYEDNYSLIEKEYAEYLEILDSFKEIYDVIILKQLFKESKEESISKLMVERYERHRKDLKLLKEMYKISNSNYNLYRKMFKSKDDLCIYDTYLHNKKSYDEFGKQIEKDYKIIKDSLNESMIEKFEKEIIEKIQEETFLPRISSCDNGRFPYQLNKNELEQILENQGKYYPFLLNKTKDGIYKIIKLLEFRIPYYVGPLNNTTSKKEIKNSNSWMTRTKENIAITPYNFNEVVDLTSSAERFIDRMIRNCTYLLDEKVMPTNSILYSKFKVLNELKQIKVGEKGKEEKLTKEIQRDIFEDLFLKESGTITDKKFKNYLKKDSNFDMYDELSVIGYSADNKFANNMQSYVDFFGSDGIFLETDYSIDEADEIIRLITVFEDKEILRKRIEKQFPELKEESIKKICSKKYKGWSNLSQKLIREIYYEDKKTKEKKNIITLLEETNENFMQILNNKTYQFQNKIDQYNKIDYSKKVNYDLVRDLATSPAIKKGIYQTLKVIEEIIEYMGYEPENIVLEMARGEEKKQRKDDRKKMLEKLYEKNKKEIENYNILSRQLKPLEKIDSEKLFLYFIQEGKSLYSGTPLDIEKLEEYEVDHIIPRTLIKDNSIDNKALVLKSENQIKAANFVLPEQFRTLYMKSFWQHLKNMKLLSTKKYNNLCRYKFDEKSISGFINRQLVETRQICKHVANIIKNYHKNSNVIYIPANLSHNYREKFQLYKFRNLNDYHHAHDAYLAAVLGEYKTNYLKPSINYDELRSLNKALYESGHYKKLGEGYVINSLDLDINGFFKFYDEEGVVTFDIENFNNTVENTLYRNDILISRKTEKKTNEFYDKTIYGVNSNKNGLSIKENLVGYGCYSSINCAYLSFIEYGNKKKLIGIPIIIDQKSKKRPEEKQEYIKNHLGLKNNDFKIVRDKIYFNSVIDYKGQKVFIVGYSIGHKNCELRNATELRIKKQQMQKWKYALNIVLNHKKGELSNEELSKILDEIIYFLLSQKNYPLFQNNINMIKQYYEANDLVLEDKKIVIEQLVNLFNCQKTNCNLKKVSDVKLKDNIGRLSGYNVVEGKVYNTSVTGVREKTYEL